MATARWVPLVVSAFLLTLAAPASASTVLISGGQLSYTAGPSEANILDIAVTDTGAATITDAPDVVVGTGGGCTNPESDNTASCTGVTVGYFVDTGDLGDSVDTSGVALLPAVSEIHGGSGNDGLLGGPCNEDIKGEQGDDVLVGQEGSDFYYGGPGTDAGRYTDISPFRVAPVTATLDTAPNDGSAGESDNVNADGLVENLSGGSENDTFTGNNGPNSLSGQDGTDTLNGVGGDDLLSGGRGPDNLSGGPDNDTMIENAANGDDTYDGGAGSDRVSYASHTSGVTVDLADPATDGAAGENDAIANVEGVTGTLADDRLLGNGGTGTFEGMAGNDFIDGRGGADAMTGGAGIDTVSYASHASGVTADLADSTTANDGEPGEGDNLAQDFEIVEGGSGADSLIGDDDANVLRGAAGSDVLLGNGGSDDIDGGEGDDTLVGDDGNDHLVGGAGADGIDGAEGDDSIRVRDGEPDVVRCLGGFDSVVGDSLDRLLQGCESFDDGQPRSGSQGPVGSPVQPGHTPPDTKAPSLTLDKLAKTVKRKAFMKGLKVGAACDESCSLLVELRGSPKQLRLARNEVVLGSGASSAGTGRRTVTIKPSRKLVGRSKRFTVQVRVTATDAAGNRTTQNVSLRVR